VSNSLRGPLDPEYGNQIQTHTTEHPRRAMISTPPWRKPEISHNLQIRLKGRFPFTFAPLEDIYRMLSCKLYFSCNRRRSNFLSQCWTETCFYVCFI